MATNIKITTTLPMPILEELEAVSIELKKPKNQILTEAFLEWNSKRKKVILKEKYIRMKTDNEMQTLVEQGITDFKHNLDQWEK